jgi:hypothetical protein
MRRFLIGLVVGIVLASAGAGYAALRAAPVKAVVLQPNQAITYGGLTCTAYAGTSPTNANLVCLRSDLKGVGVVVSRASVIVGRRKGSTVKVLFQTANR